MALKIKSMKYKDFKMEWQIIQFSEDKQNRTDRLQVMGGWIVKTFTLIQVVEVVGKKQSSRVDIKVNTSFVPDPNHFWKVAIITQDVAEVIKPKKDKDKDKDKKVKRKYTKRKV
jgi:hypothetical protein